MTSKHLKKICDHSLTTGGICRGWTFQPVDTNPSVGNPDSFNTVSVVMSLSDNSVCSSNEIALVPKRNLKCERFFPKSSIHLNSWTDYKWIKTAYVHI